IRDKLVTGVQTCALPIYLEVGESELVGLLGPNGAGKSTLVKIACGLVRPTLGRAEVCGARAGSRDARSAMGYLAELFRFPGWMKIGRASCRERVESAGYE